MPYLLWDASALAKRYTRETGSEIVEGLQTIDPEVFALSDVPALLTSG